MKKNEAEWIRVSSRSKKFQISWYSCMTRGPPYDWCRVKKKKSSYPRPFVWPLIYYLSKDFHFSRCEGCRIRATTLGKKRSSFYKQSLKITRPSNELENGDIFFLLFGFMNFRNDQRYFLWNWIIRKFFKYTRSLYPSDIFIVYSRIFFSVQVTLTKLLSTF